MGFMLSTAHEPFLPLKLFYFEYPIGLGINLELWNTLCGMVNVSDALDV